MLCTGAAVPLAPTPARAALAVGPTVLVGLPANAASAPVASLASVSCPSGTTCVAVGRYAATSARSLPLAATMTPAGWSRAVDVELPANHAGSYSSAGLSAVACPSTTSCVAVGSYEDAAYDERPMVATELDDVWGPAVGIGLPATAAATNQLAQLDAVSCTAVGSCVAVGTFTTATGATRLMAASSTAGIWGMATPLALPADPGAVPRTEGTVSLSGISCADATDCVAVGDYLDAAGGYAPIRVTLAGGVWDRAVRVYVALRARVVSTAGLAAVSCASAVTCVAVGGAANAAGVPDVIAAATQGPAGQWGDAVASGRLPGSAGRLVGASLDGVACSMLGTCVAVGAATESTGGTVALVRVDHRQWRRPLAVRSTPLPFGPATSSMLGGIACPQVDRCVAVGTVVKTSSNGVVLDALPLATVLTF